MKTTVGFFIGITVCGLALLGIQTALPTFAQTPPDENTTDNISFVDMLPDIEKIYREALSMPFIEAEKKISDEDIGAFYRKLMESTGLIPPAPEP